MHIFQPYEENVTRENLRSPFHSMDCNESRLQILLLMLLRLHIHFNTISQKSKMNAAINLFIQKKYWIHQMEHSKVLLSELYNPSWKTSKMCIVHSRARLKYVLRNNCWGVNDCGNSGRELHLIWMIPNPKWGVESYVNNFLCDLHLYKKILLPQIFKRNSNYLK